MKKIFALILIPIFLISVQGMAINTYYCKGKTSSIITQTKPCCKDVNKGGCCKKEKNVIKLTDNFVKSFTYSLKISADFYIALSTTTISKHKTFTALITHSGVNSPPIIKENLYLLFCTFII